MIKYPHMLVYRAGADASPCRGGRADLSEDHSVGAVGRDITCDANLRPLEPLWRSRAVAKHLIVHTTRLYSVFPCLPTSAVKV
jgi:hypothetical protein